MIAVVGATGVFGRHVIPRLIERGHNVRALVRQAAQVEWFQRIGVNAVIGGILDPGSRVPATLGCDAVLHLATAVTKAGQA